MEPEFMKKTLLKLKACIAPHNISGRFQHSSLRNEQIMETETRDTGKLTELMNQMHLSEIYKIVHPKARVYLILSTSYCLLQI